MAELLLNGSRSLLLDFPPALDSFSNALASFRSKVSLFPFCLDRLCGLRCNCRYGFPGPASLFGGHSRRCGAEQCARMFEQSDLAID